MRTWNWKWRRRMPPAAVRISTPLPDSRGATINVHYSISKIPNTGYQPRLADDRVGYFLTAVKDFSSKSDRDQFVRYINRWDLQKADPSLNPSPPKKQIEFYIEKTVPFKYRKAIYDGIYEWNKAFEKAGFSNAIIVKQQGDKDDIDPEDIRYNFFRWITSNAGFAMGPSRVNPYTGQILDADIIFDADFLTSWKQEYETFTARTIADMTGGELEIYPEGTTRPKAFFDERPMSGNDCALATGMSMQLAFGCGRDHGRCRPQGERSQSGEADPAGTEGSHDARSRAHARPAAQLQGEQVAEPEGHERGEVQRLPGGDRDGLQPDEHRSQGLEARRLLLRRRSGRTTMWAIEYGYKPLSGGTAVRLPELKKIASRGVASRRWRLRPTKTRAAFDPDPD